MASFESRQYGWSDLTVVLGGKVITGIQGVSYTSEQEKELVYGKGNLPLSVQSGNITYSGSITLLQSELETLEKNGGANGILDLNVDIIVSYGNPEKGDVIVTDRLQGVQFTNNPREMNQGDKNMTAQSINMIFLRKTRI